MISAIIQKGPPFTLGEFLIVVGFIFILKLIYDYYKKNR